MNKKSSFMTCGGDCLRCPQYGAKDSENEIVMVKKKVSVKYVPPDMSAIKILLERDEKDKSIDSMSDEELKKLEEELVSEYLCRTAPPSGTSRQKSGAF